MRLRRMIAIKGWWLRCLLHAISCNGFYRRGTDCLSRPMPTTVRVTLVVTHFEYVADRLQSRRLLF